MRSIRLDPELPPLDPGQREKLKKEPGPVLMLGKAIGFRSSAVS
jgi:hypothetical protein